MHAKGTHFTESMENRNFACQNTVKYQQNLMNASGKMCGCPQIMSSSTIFNIVELNQIFAEKSHHKMMMRKAPFLHHYDPKAEKCFKKKFGLQNSKSPQITLISRYIAEEIPLVKITPNKCHF